MRAMIVSVGLVLACFIQEAHGEGRAFNFPAARIQVDVPEGWGWSTDDDGSVTFVDESKDFLVIAQTMDGGNLLGALVGVHGLLKLALGGGYDCDEPSGSLHRGMATLTMNCVGRVGERRFHIVTRVFDSPKRYFLELVLESSTSGDQEDAIRSFMRSTRPMR